MVRSVWDHQCSHSPDDCFLVLGISVGREFVPVGGTDKAQSDFICDSHSLKIHLHTNQKLSIAYLTCPSTP